MQRNEIKPEKDVEQGENASRTYLIKGMDCPTCALTIEKGVENLPGIHSAKVNFASQKLKVSGESTEAMILERVKELGYEVAVEEPFHDHSGTRQGIRFFAYVFQRSDAWLFLLGLVFILPGLILHEILGREYLLVDLSSIAALAAAGFPVFRSAYQSIRLSREININVLMSIAAVGAVLIGAYTEAGMVMVLFLLGEIIEGFTGERTRDAIRSLMNLVPQTARRILRENGKTHTLDVPVSELQPGDQILIRPGEKIPMDGLVQEGHSTLNQASITGESRPVEKQAGEQVFASSINGEGALVVEVTHLAEDNTISRLVQMVEEAQEKRSSAQRFVDRFARIYTPLVVAVAFLVAVIPPLFFGQPFLNPNASTHGWLYRGLALLVVGCPCALVISTPVSIISAISNAARNGILIKGGIHLETLSAIKVFVFDKTGTLTEGKPAVIRLRSAGCIAPREVSDLAGQSHETVRQHLSRCESCSKLIDIASAVETYSEHPLAGAIVSFAHHSRRHRNLQVEQVEAVVGRGVAGRVNGEAVMVGSHRHFDEHFPHLQEVCEAARQDALQGLTPLMVQYGQDYLGTITIGDIPRASSQNALVDLRKSGIETLVMLTGDEHAVASVVAAELGIDEFHAGLLPGEKVQAVRQIQHRYGRTAMVGDGINDAPALAAADVGIAMSTALGGTAQAMETGAITLMSSNLGRLSFLTTLSKTAMKRIYFNVFFAILIKLLFFVLVIFGLGTMWMAVFADMGTTLFVTVNGMRLLRRPAPGDLP